MNFCLNPAITTRKDSQQKSKINYWFLTCRRFSNVQEDWSHQSRTKSRFNPINNWGDAGNRNPRKTSLYIPTGFKQPIHHATWASQVSPIPCIPAERSRGRTRVVPNPYQNRVQMKSIRVLKTQNERGCILKNHEPRAIIESPKLFSI